MTDQEITDAIADMMGWTWDEAADGWCINPQGSRFVARADYNPLANDSDCMAAWDKWCGLYGDTISLAEVCALAMKPGADRRRAMCERMAVPNG